MKLAICINYINVLLGTKVKGRLPERKGKNVRKKRELYLFGTFKLIFITQRFPKDFLICHFLLL